MKHTVREKGRERGRERGYFSISPIEHHVSAANLLDICSGPRHHHPPHQTVDVKHSGPISTSSSTHLSCFLMVDCRRVSSCDTETHQENLTGDNSPGDLKTPNNSSDDGYRPLISDKLVELFTDPAECRA